MERGIRNTSKSDESSRGDVLLMYFTNSRIHLLPSRHHAHTSPFHWWVNAANDMRVPMDLKASVQSSSAQFFFERVYNDREHSSRRASKRHLAPSLASEGRCRGSRRSPWSKMPCGSSARSPPCHLPFPPSSMSAASRPPGEHTQFRNSTSALGSPCHLDLLPSRRYTATGRVAPIAPHVLSAVLARPGN